MNPNEIADLSRVSPQRTFLQSHPKSPKADSTLYLSRSTTENANGGQHHTIVGVHIVLAAGDPNGLWNEFHVDRAAQKLNAKEQKKDDKKFLMATRSLIICCDTLEVRGEFCVPEADVTIYSRRLVWATADAGINTSPLEWDVPKAPDAAGTTPGENGANGRNAGSLKVFVSVVESPPDSRVGLIALGGRGQDPGKGSNGKRGADMLNQGSSAVFRIVLPPTKMTNSATVKFPTPAVYIDAKWYIGPVADVSDKRGSNSFPGNGTAAVAPGVPGNGGNGGTFCTNSRSLAGSLRNEAGAAGTKGSDYTGGRGGTPSPSAKYSVALTEWAWQTDKASYTCKMTAGPHTTSKGNDVTAKLAPKGAGSKPDPVHIECANAWLNPLSLQTVLEFARDLFLAEARTEVQELLQGYEEGLALPVPQKTTGWDDCPWVDTSLAQWTAAQTEVASILQRLRGQLDYFGNPAGYTPLLSLQGSIKLYQGETQRALRTMLLADWVNDETHTAENAVAFFGSVIDSMNEDSTRAADQVTAAGKTITSLTQELDGLEQNLTDTGNKLAAKRTELLSQAETTKQQQAIIKFSIKMAGAICQVIPVGQPALGAVGSLAGVGADLIGSDPEGVPDTVSKMGDVITKAREAAKKSNEASKKAVAESKKAATDNKDAGDSATKAPAAAKESASAMGKALDGVGPAISQVSSAISALQVPRSEVEAELQRLESECPELQQLLQEIRELNDKKTDLFGNLAAAFHSLSDGYSRLSSNAAAIVSMQQEKGKQLGRIDHEASLFVKQVGQRSRRTLLKYLYFMVKAYETTMLQTLDDVDWELSRVTAKINELLKDAKGFDATTLEDKARTLDGLFQENINVVRQKLLDDSSRFSEITMPRTLVLSSTQSPDDVAALNQAGSVVIDPFAYGFVDPKTQLARLSDADLISLELDPKGPQLPEGSQVIVDMIPSRTGTLRRDEALCAVYSEAPVRWNWTYSIEPDAQRPSRPKKSLPSKGAEDLLDFILGDGSDKIRQTIARPPFWSNLTIGVRYLPAPADDKKKPRITKLHFRLSSDVTPASDRQCVLMVHPTGPSAGSVVDCAPKDLAGREAGFGHFMRIYNQGADIRLSAPAAAFGASFDHWQLIGTGLPDIHDPDAGKVKLKDDVVATCYWIPARDRVAKFDLIGSLNSVQLAKVAETCPDEELRKSLRLHVNVRASGELLRATVPDIGQLIRVEPRDDGSVVGRVPPREEADLLQEGKDGWREVNYRGVAGWVRA